MKNSALLTRQRYLLAVLALVIAAVVAGISAAATSQTHAGGTLGPLKIQPTAVRDSNRKSVTVSGSFACSGAGSRVAVQISVVQKSTGALGVGRFPDLVGLDQHSAAFKARALKSACRGHRAGWRAKVERPPNAVSGRPFKGGAAKACAIAYQLSRGRFSGVTAACRPIRVH